MSSAYFASMVTLPIVIDGPGRYVTRGGEIVTIETVGRNHAFNCYGAYANGVRDSWHRSGRLFASITSSNDIVGAAS